MCLGSICFSCRRIDAPRHKATCNHCDPQPSPLRTVGDDQRIVGSSVPPVPAALCDQFAQVVELEVRRQVGESGSVSCAVRTYLCLLLTVTL